MGKPFNPMTIKFSRHAKQRFLQRFKGQSSIEAARKLLDASSLEKIDPVKKVRAIINSRFEEAEYYRHGQWRFVIVKKGDKHLVRTFEEIYA